MRGEYLKAALLCLGALFCLGCALLHIEKAAEEKRHPEGIRAPEHMVYIPPGEVKVQVFERRHKHGAWLPDYEIEEVSEGFFIDKYEFPNVAGEFPLSNVTYVEAQRMCAEQGKRLCTMHEWLRACQGPKMKEHCYGNTYIKDRCNAFKVKKDWGQSPPILERSGSRERCKSDYGVYDMTGNLWEWTSEPVVRRYCRHTKADYRVLLGGCWGIECRSFPCNGMTTNQVEYRWKTFGFRCCMDAD